MLCSLPGKHGCYTDWEYIMPYHVPNATHCNNNDSDTFILTVTITFSRFSGTSRGINTHIKCLNVVFLAQECIMPCLHIASKARLHT